jgi:hypothetical protein
MRARITNVENENFGKYFHERLAGERNTIVVGEQVYNSAVSGHQLKFLFAIE